MVTLHIANNRTAEMAGDPTVLEPAERAAAGCGAERVMWFAEDGDVIVVPHKPDDSYIRYVTDLIGVDAASLGFVVPQPGYAGPELLTEDRLAASDTRSAIKHALAGRPLDNVLAFYPDRSVAALAQALGAESAFPGHAFFAQGGSALANSKAVFRAVAAGVDIPIAPGAVTSSREVAVGVVSELVGAGMPVIVKREFHNGSYGNEILTPAPGVAPFGAQRVVVLPAGAAVEGYFDEQWDWLTDHGAHELVIERYFVGARPMYAEFLVTDRTVDYTGQGLLLMSPVFEGVVIPIPDAAPDVAAAMVDRGRRLCEAYRAMGYRGTMSVDGIETADGQVLLNETNSRFSGSTHLHDMVARRVVGARRVTGRTMYEKGGWQVPSFGDGVSLLAESGLGYDPERGGGVILTCDFARADGTVRYCVVANDFVDAKEIERKLLAVVSS